VQEIVKLLNYLVSTACDECIVYYRAAFVHLMLTNVPALSNSAEADKVPEQLQGFATGCFVLCVCVRVSIDMFRWNNAFLSMLLSLRADGILQTFAKWFLHVYYNIVMSDKHWCAKLIRFGIETMLMVIECETKLLGAYNDATAQVTRAETLREFQPSAAGPHLSVMPRGLKKSQPLAAGHFQDKKTLANVVLRLAKRFGMLAKIFLTFVLNWLAKQQLVSMLKSIMLGSTSGVRMLVLCIGFLWWIERHK